LADAPDGLLSRGRAYCVTGVSAFSQKTINSSFRNAESTFENPSCNLLRLSGVTLLRRELVGRPHFNSLAFLFGVAIAYEKLTHFSLKCHFFLRFLCFDVPDEGLEAQSKSSGAYELTSAGIKEK
jgi:hypothetical protein